MDRLVASFADYPFLLALAAAAFAELSSIMLRRTSSILGARVWYSANALSGVSALGLVWSLVWAANQGRMLLPRDQSGLQVLGSLAMMAGAVLIFAAVRVLGSRTLFPARTANLETRPPYRFVRRPIGVGLALLGLGAALVSGSPPLWHWLGVWFILWQPLFELEEWELKARLPRAQAYFAQTPRYIPWKRMIRSREPWKSRRR